MILSLYYDGAVKDTVFSEDYVFDDINENAKQDVFCAANSNYNEVMWFYASANSDQIDRMVIYNYAEKLWYIGTLARTSWSDYGVYPVPYATQFLSTDTTATISTITGLKLVEHLYSYMKQEQKMMALLWQTILNLVI